MSTHFLALLAPVLTAVAFDWRDGHPATGKTFTARLCGTIGVVVACLFGVQEAWALLLGAFLGGGFWLDQKHGEGQGAATLSDAVDLLISGATSLAPAALCAFFFDWHIGVALLVTALCKPPLWFLAWRVDLPSWLEPTRAASIVFGALTGLAVML